MSEGTILHHGLAALYIATQNGYPQAESLASAMVSMEAMADRRTYEYHGEQQDLAPDACSSETLDRLKSVLTYYAEHSFERTMEGKRVLAVEEAWTFELDGAELIGGFVMDGTFDLVLEHINKPIIEVHDFKTVSLVSTAVKFLGLNQQMLWYEVLANQAFANKQVEMVYNLIRRDVPPGYGYRPRTTKSGKPSSASQNVEDYLHEHRFAHSTHELAAIRSNLMLTVAQAQLLLAGGSAAYPPTAQRRPIKTGGEACHTSCAYFSRCCAELIGHTEPTFVPMAVADED
jgi:hypothetical protein